MNIDKLQVEEFYKLIEQVDNAKDHDELKAHCEQLCEMTELPWYVLGVIGQASSYAPTVRVLSNYPEAWLNKYFKDGKQQADPVIKYIFERQSPIRWDKLMDASQFASSQGLQVFEEAAKYGLYNGISFPMKSASENIAVFCLAVDKRPDAIPLLDNAQMFGHTFATHLFERFLQLEISDPENEEKNLLTKRELECLFWACEGKTAWEISQIVNVSERTVLFHLNNSTAKLGAVNRQHAVALAIKKGLIKPNI